MNRKGPQCHHQHLDDHDAIGLQLFVSGQYSKPATATCQSTLAASLAHSTATSSSSSSGHYPQGFGQLQCSLSDFVSTRPQEHVFASLPNPPGKLSSDPVRESPAQCIGTSPSPTREHAPISQFSPSRILTPPDSKFHSTLSCWIKNMNKLSSVIDRLQELASSAPAEHRSQLLGQVVALRATSKKQKEHFMEFLRLSEDYANRYLLDIAAEIKQQSSFLEKLEGRLEVAKKLRREAVDLKRLYESGTVATINDLRAKTLPRPLLEDQALFSELDLVLTGIRRCYVELDKFWTEEISRAVEALKMRRVDSTDLERWKNCHANLKQTIESWKPIQTKLPSRDTQTLRRNNACLSKEADVGAIASSFSTAMGSLKSALDRLLSSKSLKYTRSGSSSVQPIYVALAANSHMCLSLLRSCADYGEKVISLPSIALPSFCMVASHDLRERTMRLVFEISCLSVEDAASVKGSRKFKAAYKDAICLEQKMTSGLNTLFKKLLSRVTDTDGHGLPDDALPDVASLKQLRKLWEKAGESLCGALATLKNEPAPRLSTKPLSWMKQRLMNFM